MGNTYTPSHSAFPLLIQGEATACSGRHRVNSNTPILPLSRYGDGLVQKLRVKKALRVTIRAQLKGEFKK
jgi:hypothetical protein